MTKNNRIYSWGDNKHGQLGFDPKKVKNLKLPMEIIFNWDFGFIQKILCGWTHSVAFDNHGRIWSWGRNVYGQLGCENVDGVDFWRAKCVQGLEKIQKIKVGSEHNTAIDGYFKNISFKLSN